MIYSSFNKAILFIWPTFLLLQTKEEQMPLPPMSIIEDPTHTKIEKA